MVESTGGQNLDDLLGEFEDETNEKEEKKEDDAADPKVHKMQREGFKLTKDKDGNKVINDFLTIHEKIGSGGYCKVYRAEGVFPPEPPEYPDEERIPYALKQYERHALEKQFVNVSRPALDGKPAASGMHRLKDVIMDEIDAWSELKHTNIVKALTWFEHPSQDKMYLRMQLADLGTIARSSAEDADQMLFNPNPKVYDVVLNKLNTNEELKAENFGAECKSDKEKVFKFIFCQISEGLQYLHDNRVANRDLKPENMLFTTKEGGTDNRLYDRAQITDFTTAIKLPENNTDDFMITDSQGTKLFEAPECSQGNPFRPKPLDIWAFGVSIYVMVFGRAPFGHKGITEAELTTEIREKDPVLDFDENPVSDELKQLLTAMLTKDPASRPTIAQCREYAWFKGLTGLKCNPGVYDV